MIEKLIVDFFRRVEEREGITKRHGKAKFLVEELLEKKYGKFNYISIQKASRLHKKYVEEEHDENVAINDSFLKNVLAEYLGYKDYEDFQKQNEVLIVTPQKGNGDQEVERGKTEGIEIIKEPDIQIAKEYKNWKKTGLVSITILSSLYIAIIINKDILFNSNECIVWKIDHYEKSSCFISGAIDNTKHKVNIDLFKKVAVDTSTVFFTNGRPNYWYGENEKGKGEFFTHRGIHPQTKKELKPINRIIINSEGLLNE
ncbi:hypothetical protein [Tenacibaculum sp. 190524A05c]|uniref:hypothetical protein n=1 Tax=Tenacibaculum platacis TaxID=3137852 RepID=UPI0032B16FFB